MGRGRPRVDLTGRRFGRWTVIGFSHRDGVSHYRCRCDCGSEKVIRQSVLQTSVKGACNRCALLAKPIYKAIARQLARGARVNEIARRVGRSRQQVSDMLKVVRGNWADTSERKSNSRRVRSEKPRNTQRDDLSGRQFGLWTVLCRSWGGRQSFYLCRCHCGFEKIIRRSVLLHSVKGCCDRCSKLAKPLYQTVFTLLAEGLSFREIARRLGRHRQQISLMAKVIREGETRKQRDPA